MKQSFKILIICWLLVTCKEPERTVETIDFDRNYLFSDAIETKVARDTMPWKFQVAASDYAKKGDYRNALLQWDADKGGTNKAFTKRQIDSIYLKYSKINASDYIIKQANKSKIVIINEAHHSSLHRVFTKSLLKKLFTIGYKNLGLEALASGKFADSLLLKRGYPIDKSGYYVNDPQFGNLIRTALEIGYTVFPYEQTTNVNGRQREIEQAKNIQKAIENDPNEKFLIHCGFDHALEGVHASWEKAMAGRLAAYTNINPLTINQVVYSERGNPDYNHPLLKALDIKESSVIIDNDNNPLRYERGEAWTDIAVFHPNTNYIDQRPQWLFDNENHNTQIFLTNLEIEFPVMVLAFKKGDDIQRAIPIDIVEVKDKLDNCSLGLKNGIYEIVVTNGNTSLKFEQTVK